MKKIAPVLLIASFLVACQDSEPTGPSEPGPVSLAIDDGAHGGNSEFFFLPPLVSNPKKNSDFDDSEFNPDLAPFVRICELNNADPPNCVVDLAPDLPMAVNLTKEQYKVKWVTRDFSLDNTLNYRIQVMVGTNTVIGFRDVNPEQGSKRTAKCGDEPFCKINNGRTLPIEVRIEEFAFCPDTRMCETKSFNLDDGASFDFDNNLLDIPGQTSTDQVTVTFQECEVDDVDDQIDLPTFEACLETVILTDGFDGELDINATAIMSLCNLDFHSIPGVSAAQAAHLRLHHFREDGDVEALRPADNCAAFSSLPSNPLLRLASRIRDGALSWLGARPLIATAAVGHRDAGGNSLRTIRSKFKLALPLKIDFVNAVDETRIAAVSDTLTTEAIVTDIAGNPAAGATVRWNVVLEPTAEVAGSVIPSSATCATDGPDDVVCTTDATGIIEVRWILDTDPGVNELTAGGRGIADSREAFNGPRDGTYTLGPFDPFTPILFNEKMGDGIDTAEDEIFETIVDDTRLLFTATGFEYTIEHDGVISGVEPLVGSLDIVAFYSYNSPDGLSANTGLEKSDTSVLFLYQDGSGNVSLVMIHDKPNDVGGGKAEFAFSGVPGGASFVVRDDPLLDMGNPVDEAILPTSTWRWASCCTDGGALGFLNPGFAITITPSFPATGGIGGPGQITAWTWLTGSLASPTAIALTVGNPGPDIIIRRSSGP